jgi:hypothetical protein
VPGPRGEARGLCHRPIPWASPLADSGYNSERKKIEFGKRFRTGDRWIATSRTHLFPNALFSPPPENYPGPSLPSPRRRIPPIPPRAEALRRGMPRMVSRSPPPHRRRRSPSPPYGNMRIRRDRSRSPFSSRYAPLLSQSWFGFL